jgi:hypothetical protein
VRGGGADRAVFSNSERDCLSILEWTTSKFANGPRESVGDDFGPILAIYGSTDPFN